MLLEAAEVEEEWFLPLKSLIMEVKRHPYIHILFDFDPLVSGHTLHPFGNSYQSGKVTVILASRPCSVSL